MDFFERCSESEAVAEAVELQQADQSNKAFSQEQIEANAIPKAAIAPVPLEADNGFSNVDHPKGIRFALLFSCIIVGCFLFGYDTSCIATLTPVITDQFHALNDLGWYAIAYSLAQSATVLIYGQLYSFYSMKTLYMSSMFVFVIGSTLSAAAPISPAFIIGRALNGLGAAGVFAGTNIIVALTTSLERRPIYSAVVGAIECTALAFGPLIGGAIAHYSSWRVSFYVIIPIGVAVIVVVFISVDHLRRPENATLTNKAKLKRIDWIGFAVNVPMALCLVLGLQWAGTTYPWTNWRIILLFVLASVLVVAFLIVEHRAGDASMVPLKMLRQRSVAFSSIITFCNYAHLSVLAYYIPFYFQAVRGATTLSSGLMYLPTAVALAIAGLAGGPITSAIGYYNPVLMLGSVLMTVGMGFITTLRPDTSAGRWIGFQIIYGIGVGLAFQPPYTAVQTILDDTIVPMALVMLSFTQQLGGIVVLSIAQNVFLNRLADGLATEVPSLDPSIVLNSGALGLLDKVPAEYRKQVLFAYNEALVDVFYIALGLTCLATVSVFGIQWKSVKEEKKQA